MTTWTFPSREIFYFRGETLFVGVLTLFVFLASFYTFEPRWIYGIVVAAIFFLLYVITAYLIHHIRGVEETYELTKTHLHITRKTNRRVRKEKVALKDVHTHKLDSWFLGGYLLTKKAKHLVFFNSKKELNKLKKALK